MRVIHTSIPDVIVLEPKVFFDERGFFMESYNSVAFEEAVGQKWDFVQDNHSRSTKHVLRGLHYQVENPQGKLVRVVKGAVYDVAVDIRKSSPTYGQWVGMELSEDNHHMAWVPPGFAHGFVVLSETAEFLYKTTNLYSRGHERSIVWNDPDLKIDWKLGDIIPNVSSKDAEASSFKQAEVFA